jgi:hypothetical protein
MSTNTEKIDRVTIDHNLMSGGGYTVYCGTTEGGVATNSSYTRNVISREYFRNGGRWGATTHCDRVSDGSGNVWDGEYVPPTGEGAPAGQAPSGAHGSAPAASGEARKVTLATARRAAKRALARGLKSRYTKRSAGVSVRCKRRDAGASCAVRWVKRRAGRTLDRYRGTVTVKYSTATRLRCAVKVRHWARECRCTSRIPGPRAKADALVVRC